MDILGIGDFRNEGFRGVEHVVAVLIAQLQSTKKITLHSKDLQIILVQLQKGKKAIDAIISYDEENETATFSFPRAITPGIYKLHTVFKGILGSNMRGFYKSQYVLDGKTQTMATTQFEATDARRAFPCFDEPALKATFKISVIHRDDYNAISNMPVDKITRTLVIF